MNLQAAYDACEREARSHHENFPVASLLIGKRMRPHVAAIYAFARVADDFADEGTRSDGERYQLLDGWTERLRACVESDRPGPAAVPGEPANAPQIFLALGNTIRTCALPRALFEDLLSAFRQDVAVHAYDTWPQLFDYCRRSANPVGRLVLRIAGYSDGVLDARSDAICTALQLTNFWQDLAIDFRRGRVYMPVEEMRLHRARVSALARDRLAAPWKAAVASALVRTRQLYADGKPLCDAVRGRLRYELRATWLGGMRILELLERSGHDPFTHRPRLTAGDAAVIAWRAVSWQ